MQNLWLPPKSPKSMWYSVKNCLHEFYKFICVLQVSETKKGILLYFDKNVLGYFITLVFIALYEYCIESPSIQFTHRNYTVICRVTKAVNTLHSTKSTLQKFKNSKYQKVQLKKTGINLAASNYDREVAVYMTLYVNLKILNLE